MVTPIIWRNKTRIKNLDELLDNRRLYGGWIIQYERVWSFILFSQSVPVFEWVPPGKSRRTMGLKHAVFCALFGWWSPSGFFQTPGGIINNLLGGIDVTMVLTTPAPSEDGHFDEIALKELRAEQNRQSLIYFAFLVVVLIMGLTYLAWPYLP